MKAKRITYISLAGKPEPYGAQVGTQMVNRQVNESLKQFKQRCEELLAMMVQK